MSNNTIEIELDETLQAKIDADGGNDNPPEDPTDEFDDFDDHGDSTPFEFYQEENRVRNAVNKTRLTAFSLESDRMKAVMRFVLQHPSGPMFAGSRTNLHTEKELGLDSDVIEARNDALIESYNFIRRILKNSNLKIEGIDGEAD